MDILLCKVLVVAHRFRALSLYGLINEAPGVFIVVVVVAVSACALVQLLTKQVLHALSRLDDLGADRRAADPVQGVVGFGDDLNVEGQKLALLHTHWSCL